MKVLRNFFIIIGILLVPIVGLSAQSPAIDQLIAMDIANWGNGADLQISFSTAYPQDEHRILIMPSEQGISTDMAQAVEHYVSITPETESVTVTLDDTARDIDGSPLSEDTPYKVYILVNDVLFKPSQEVMLVNEAIVRTIVAELDAAAGGLETDGDGNLYFADFGEPQISYGQTVYQITPAGEVSVYVEGQGLGVSTGNAFDSARNYYQSSLQNNLVVQVSPDGDVTTFSEEGLSSPVGITIDADDTLFVTNCNGGSIQQITADGESTQFVKSSLLKCPNGITLDDDHNLYVTNYNNGGVIRITPDGDVEEFATLTGLNNAHILYRDGILYAASRGGHRIYTLTLNGEATVLAGTGERGNQDGLALDATFNLPNDLAFSPDGRILYINEVLATTDKRNYPSVIRAIILPRVG